MAVSRFRLPYYLPSYCIYFFRLPDINAGIPRHVDSSAVCRELAAVKRSIIKQPFNPFLASSSPDPFRINANPMLFLTSYRP